MMRKILFSVALILAGCSSLAMERDIEVVTDTFRLPGTLSLPDGVVEKVPCVVFVHGSGPNDRNETIGPNNVFKDLADSLSAKGIASLRYDKRTLVYRANFVPQGKEANYDFEVIDDAVSAVALAQSVPEVDATKVYVVGHSLGAMLAPEIASRAKDVAGIVMLAAPSEKLPDMMIYQTNYLKGIYAEMGASQAVRMAEELSVKCKNAKLLGTPEYDPEIGLPDGLTESYLKADSEYDAIAVAKALDMKMFLVFGMRDYQVPYSNYAKWQKALAGKLEARVKLYFGLNHILRIGSGKPSPMEYTEAKPISAEVVADIVDFVRK